MCDLVCFNTTFRTRKGSFSLPERNARARLPIGYFHAFRVIVTAFLFNHSAFLTAVNLTYSLIDRVPCTLDHEP